MNDRRHFDRIVDFLFLFLFALDLGRRLLHGLAGALRLFFLFLCFLIVFLFVFLFVVLAVVLLAVDLLLLGLVLGRGGRGRLFGLFRHRAFDFARVRNVQHGRRHSVRARQHAGDARGKFAVRAVVDGDEQTLEVGHKASLFELLALKPLFFFLAHRDAAERPAQRRRHGGCGDHRHGDNHREEVLIEGAHRQSDGRDNDFSRTARVHPAGECQTLAPRQPAEFRTDERAGKFSDAGNEHEADREQRDLRIGQDGEIGGQSGDAEKDRRKERSDKPAQLFVDMPRQDRGFADQNAGNEGTKHGMHADQMRNQGHNAHDAEDGGDHRELADEMIVYPADRKKHGASADRQACDHERDGSNDALRERHRFDRAVQGETEDDRNDDPADAIVDDRGCEDHLADDAAHEIHFAHDHGDDFHRCDRERGSEKERGDQPLAGVRQHAVGQGLAKRDTADERDDDAHQRGEQRRTARLAHQFEIGLHPCEQKQQQDAELRDPVDHRLLFGIFRKQCVLHVGKQQAEKGRAEQEAGDQLAHHGGLAQA